MEMFSLSLFNLTCVAVAHFHRLKAFLTLSECFCDAENAFSNVVLQISLKRNMNNSTVCFQFSRGSVLLFEIESLKLCDLKGLFTVREKQKVSVMFL